MAPFSTWPKSKPKEAAWNFQWQEAAQNQTCAVHYARNIYACIVWFVVAQKAVDLSERNNGHCNPNQFHPLAPLAFLLGSSSLASQCWTGHASNPVLTDHNRTSWNLHPCFAEELRLETSWCGKKPSVCSTEKRCLNHYLQDSSLRRNRSQRCADFGPENKVIHLCNDFTSATASFFYQKSAMAKDRLSMVKRSEEACMCEYLKSPNL